MSDVMDAKPCPFCGAKPEVDRGILGTGGVFITCQTVWPDGTECGAYQYSFEAWNARPRHRRDAMSDDTPVSVEEHAARLRLIRNMHGMLMHPESAKVLDDAAFGRIIDTLTILQEVTPMTTEEFIEYGRAGANDLEVRWSEEKGRYVFAYTADNAMGKP